MCRRCILRWFLLLNEHVAAQPKWLAEHAQKLATHTKAPVAHHSIVATAPRSSSGICSVILEEQLSRSPCIYNETYGCHDGVVWTRSCRGRFSCEGYGVSFRCGFPPSWTRLNCSCDGQYQECGDQSRPGEWGLGGIRACDGQGLLSARSCIVHDAHLPRLPSSRPPPDQPASAEQAADQPAAHTPSSTCSSGVARIAIGFYGSVRSLNLVIHTIQTNLLAPLRRTGGVDVFAYGLSGADIGGEAGPITLDPYPVRSPPPPPPGRTRRADRPSPRQPYTSLDGRAGANPAKCCTSPVPEPSMMGRCAMRASASFCSTGSLCPVACGRCIICPSHPMFSAYVSLRESLARDILNAPDPGCVDDHSSCEVWAKTGECDRAVRFMNKSCKASCHVCNGGKPPPKKRLTPCQWLRHPDGECGHAALQKYLAACRVQLDDQVNVDLRYRLEHRAQCNAQGRTVVGHHILTHQFRAHLKPTSASHSQRSQDRQIPRSHRARREILVIPFGSS